MISEPRNKYWGRLNDIWAPLKILGAQCSMVSEPLRAQWYLSPTKKLGGSMISISPAKNIGGGGSSMISEPPPQYFFFLGGGGGAAGCAPSPPPPPPPVPKPMGGLTSYLQDRLTQWSVTMIMQIWCQIKAQTLFLTPLIIKEMEMCNFFY